VPEHASGSLRGLERQTVTFDAVVTEEGLQKLVSLLDVSGLLTVGDALTEEETDRLFLLTESENYAGIVDVEKFLAGDLLTYARAPSQMEQQLLQSFSSEAFLEQFRSLIAVSRLKAAADVLGGEWGKAYAEQRVWPVQYLQPQRVAVEELGDGKKKVSMTLSLYSRP
jgi:hypothetical protein